MIDTTTASHVPTQPGPIDLADTITALSDPALTAAATEWTALADQLKAATDQLRAALAASHRARHATAERVLHGVDPDGLTAADVIGSILGAEALPSHREYFAAERAGRAVVAISVRVSACDTATAFWALPAEVTA